MPNYKVVDAGRLDAAMTATADAIREKTSGTYPIPWNADTGFAEAVAGITGGGAAVSVPMKDVNFYDYDGTRLYSYTVAEAAALTEMPPLPTQPGLICQGWNWTLDAVKAMGRAVDVGAMYITDDGKTRIYITLSEGRTSPMLGCCPNGTVTVDWGDGTALDGLTGNSTTEVKWTPNHNYEHPGDYVITLGVIDGSMSFAGDINSNTGILQHSSITDGRNAAYKNAVKNVEIGGNVTTLSQGAFQNCTSLKTVSIPAEVLTVYGNVFQNCSCLQFVTIPYQVTLISGLLFSNCYSLSAVSIPGGVGTVSVSAFEGVPNTTGIIVPDGITRFTNYAFRNCKGLTSAVMPKNISNLRTSVFEGCSVVRYYDFARSSSVPSLSNANAFTGISEDCEIRVPAVLADEWKAATNWSTYADYIVGV